MHLKPILVNEDKTIDMYAAPDCQQLIDMYNRFCPKVGFVLPWVGYFIIRQDRIVGSCGFTGQPTDNKVEIAYRTFKEFEGQGIASFACIKLIYLTYQTDKNLTITAKTAPEHNASAKILENNNFVFTGIVQDDEIRDA